MENSTRGCRCFCLLAPRHPFFCAWAVATCFHRRQFVQTQQLTSRAHSLGVLLMRNNPIGNPQCAKIPFCPPQHMPPPNTHPCCAQHFNCNAVSPCDGQQNVADAVNRASIFCGAGTSLSHKLSSFGVPNFNPNTMMHVLC